MNLVLEHDPLSHHAGLAAEFDPFEPPPGFSEAQIGELTDKVKVEGTRCRRLDAPEYRSQTDKDESLRAQLLFFQRTGSRSCLRSFLPV